MSFATDAIARAREQHGPGDLVPGRGGVDDAALGVELAALIDERETPSLVPSRDETVHLYLVRLLLGEQIVSAPLGPWRPPAAPVDEGVEAVLVIDEPSRNGRSQSAVAARYIGGEWVHATCETVDTFAAWLPFDDESHFLTTLLDGREPASWGGG